MSISDGKPELAANWRTVSLGHRRDGERGRLFRAFGSPTQDDGRISAEELKNALEYDDARQPVLFASFPQTPLTNAPPSRIIALSV
jgi:hypothetical protein